MRQCPPSARMCASSSSPSSSSSTQASEPAPPRRVAWTRTRQLIAVLIFAALVLVGLALVASQSGPDAIDLQATLYLQRITLPAFATLMYVVSWPGYNPQ